MALSFHDYRTVRVHAYDERLTAPMVRAFKIFVESYTRQRKPLALKDFFRGNVDRSEYGNFAKMKYFGVWSGGRFYPLIEPDTESGRKWVLTEIGERFYRGELAVTTPVAHLNDKPLPRTHEAWKTWKGAPLVFKEVYIHDIVPKTPKQHPEYREEAIGDQLL